MSAGEISCTRCGAPVPADGLNRSEPTPCPQCGAGLLVAAFPALVDEAGAPAPEAVTDEGQASCFYHRANKAVVPCDACGRFLCALCDVRIGRHHLCPACVASAGRGRPVRLRSASAPGAGAALDLVGSRVLYDDIALFLGIIPAGVTAVAALALAWRYFSAPRSVLSPGPLRWVLAVVVSLVQIGWWCWALLLW